MAGAHQRQRGYDRCRDRAPIAAHGLTSKASSRMLSPRRTRPASSGPSAVRSRLLPSRLKRDCPSRFLSERMAWLTVLCAGLSSTATRAKPPRRADASKAAIARKDGSRATKSSSVPDRVRARGQPMMRPAGHRRICWPHCRVRRASHAFALRQGRSRRAASAALHPARALLRYRESTSGRRDRVVPNRPATGACPSDCGW